MKAMITPASKQDHEREGALLNAALQLTDDERAAFLNHACGENLALRQRLEDLLRAHKEAGTFLGRPVAPTSAARSTLGIANVAGGSAISEAPGDLIGRYKLLQKIGEGGCGVVYMAEQEEPVHRRVALKIIKLGMDTKSVIARFEAERQALALMDHPNIAKVHDAGATDTGRPYFVMELVRGVKVTDFCDEKNLSPQQRLDLFVQVCHAVQHAHQKGIIHRDLKPSNILVNIVDGLPVPKVIDFGIAKATNDQRLTDKTVFTAFEQFIGTPAYMSPEQAEISGVDLDTRSDIYSLGVLLYELLTGKTPFDTKELLQAGLDVMRRTIREKEPDRPSTRVRTLAADELTTTAKRRGVEPPKLASVLCGDLDWIVMKCLEKDRARRYETADGLAMDLQRHLKNEPVVACPPGNLYRFQKLVRRNQGVFAAVGAVVAALVIGLFVSTWMFLRERESKREQLRLRREAETARNNETEQRREAQFNEKRARTEAEKSQQAARFLKEMLKGVGPSVALGRDTTLLKEILDKTAERVSKDLTNQPEVAIELCATLSETYNALSLLEQGEKMAEEGLQIARSSLGEQHLGVARAIGVLGESQYALGKLDRAENSLRQALAMNRKLLGDEDAEQNYLQFLAEVLQLRGKLDEAESMSRQVLTMNRKLKGNEHPDVAASLNNLAVLLKTRGKLDEAETLQREALAMQRKLYGSNHPEIAISLSNLAGILEKEGKVDEAESLCGEALALQTKLCGRNSLAVAYSLNNLAEFLASAGKLYEAESAYRESFAILHEHHDPHWITSLRALARILVLDDKRAEAEDLFRDCLPPNTEYVPERASELADFLLHRATFFAQIGKWKESAADLGQVIELRPEDTRSWHTLAAVLVQQGDLEAYREHCRKSLGRFANTTDPLAAEGISKDCLLLASSGADLDLVARMTDFAVSAPTKPTNYPPLAGYWSHLCKGLAEYRRGNFALAVDWTQRAVTDAEAHSDWGALGALIQGQAVLAMAQHHLKQIAEARTNLAKGLEIADAKLAKYQNGYLDGMLARDWIAAHALMREAQLLIEGDSRMAGQVQSAGSRAQDPQTSAHLPQWPVHDVSLQAHGKDSE
jgi:tetratricopeptide (TPR) repeat protein